MFGMLDPTTFRHGEYLGETMTVRSVFIISPANWHPGEDTVVLPFISDEDAEQMFAEQGGFRKVRPYLRYVRDPSLRIV
jgi:hypothetical protein